MRFTLQIFAIWTAFSLLLGLAIGPIMAQQNTPRTIRLHNNATGEHLGTVTITGNTMYLRDKNGEHVFTVIGNPDGTRTTFDPHGNIISYPPNMPKE